MIDCNSGIVRLLLPSLVLAILLFGLVLVLTGGDGLVGYGSLIVGGIGVFLLFDYALRGRGQDGTHCAEYLLLGVLLLMSLAVRIPLLEYQTGDYQTIASWHTYIKQHGGLAALGSSFSNYPPAFLYLLALTTYLPLNSLYAIKTISIVFDYFAAFWAYKLVELKYPSTILPWLSFLVVVFTPTVVVNGSMWAQSDVIYGSFLLGSLYFLVRSTLAKYGRGGASRDWIISLTMFALAFSFKLQAVFLVIPLLFLYVSRRVSWFYFLIIPFIYFFFMLPTYFMGRSLIDLTSIYINQIVLFDYLTFHAPSVYVLFSQAPASMFTGAGVLMTISAVLLIVFLLLRKRVSFTCDNVVRVAMVSVLLIPYLLPRMHERYFFAADLVAVVFAFYFPRYWYVPIGIISVSFLSYFKYLTDQWVVDPVVLGLILGVVLVVVLRDFVFSSLMNEKLSKLKKL